MSTQAHPIERAEPLREAVYSRIVSAIVNGAYRPGQSLTEAVLSRSLDVSRTPVREALLRLEAEGVLESTLARGFTLKPLSSQESGQLYPVLAELEGLAIAEGAERLRHGSAELTGILDELESSDDPVSRWRLDSAFHDRIAASADNPYLLTLLRQIRTNLSRYELTYMRAVTTRSTADGEHRAIVAAIVDHDVELARRLLREHWLSGMALVRQWIDTTEDEC